MIAEPTTHRFVAVLNKKLEPGRLMNALGHMSVGLATLFGEDRAALRVQTYVDANGSEHKNISDNPFIVLRADNGNQIRALRNRLIEEGIKFTDFADTMVEGTYVEQHARTQQTPEADLDYFGICFFVEDTKSRELTKKFSLWH